MAAGGFGFVGCLFAVVCGGGVLKSEENGGNGVQFLKRGISGCEVFGVDVHSRFEGESESFVDSEVALQTGSQSIGPKHASFGIRPVESDACHAVHPPFSVKFRAAEEVVEVEQIVSLCRDALQAFAFGLPQEGGTGGEAHGTDGIEPFSHSGVDSSSSMFFPLRRFGHEQECRTARHGDEKTLVPAGACLLFIARSISDSFGNAITHSRKDGSHGTGSVCGFNLRHVVLHERGTRFQPDVNVVIQSHLSSQTESSAKSEVIVKMAAGIICFHACHADDFKAMEGGRTVGSEFREVHEIVHGNSGIFCFASCDMIVAGLCAKAPAVFRRTPVTEGCFHSHAGSNVVSCAHELESDSSVEEGVVHPGFVFKSFGDARFL